MDRRAGSGVRRAIHHDDDWSLDLDHIDYLRHLSVCDVQALAAPGLDALSPRQLAIVRFAALVGTGGSSASFAAAADEAIRSGVTDAELVDAIAGALPIVGSPRAVAAAQHLAVALELDLETFVDGS
jgi:alkylhydroperoxidase/carboxymuconolactone decarboxylase family protein YurZ